jgi:hypothetical protein
MQRADRFGEHVRRGVAQQIQRVGIVVLRGDDLDRAVALDRAAEVADLVAVEFDADGALSETGPDRLGDLRAGHWALEFEDLAVRKCDAWHGNWAAKATVAPPGVRACLRPLRNCAFAALPHAPHARAASIRYRPARSRP